MLNRKDALAKLARQLTKLNELYGMPDPRKEYGSFQKRTEVVLERMFGRESRHLKDFQDISYVPIVFSAGTSDSEFLRVFKQGMASAKQILDAATLDVEEFWPSSDDNDDVVIMKTPSAAFARVERICSRFHLVAKQLRQRHAGRNTLDVKDEYDVQDLLHALLRIEFDDVREEESSPSYAGKGARLDFLLPEFDVVVEAKMTREGLADKEIGDQLIIDIHRYTKHPNCKKLICFVYDPEGRMRNPRGVENDLNKRIEDSMEVKVLVIPSGV